MAGEMSFDDLNSANVIGGDLFNSLFSSFGFQGAGDGFGGYGAKDNPWMEQLGWNEQGTENWGTRPNEAASSFLKDYTFNWNPTDPTGEGTLDVFDPTGKSYGQYQQKGEDGFTQLMNMVAPAVAGWGFGGALSGMFGGGVTGTALGHGVTNGALASMQGGDFGKGFLGGAIGGGLQGLAAGTPAVVGNNPSAYVPATPGTSIAGTMGVTNPLASGMINRGTGSFLSSLAQGNSGSEALKSGLTGAALSGINSVGKSVMGDYMSSLKSWMGTPDAAMGSGSMSDELDALGGNMVSDPMDQSVDPMAYSDEGARFDNSADFSYGFQPSTFLGSGSGPDQSIQSVGQSDFSLPSIFGAAGSRLGNFALNNAGDLASMLYGFYNNRRQQKALGQQMNTLQGLYGQNSAYAKQLRNTLNAKAAATGRRSNVAGRETQLQAMLADKASSLMPTLMQMNMQRGSLKNNNMNMLLQGANKMGLFSGLGSLFGGGNNPYGNYSMSQNTDNYNLLGGLEGSR